MRKALSYCISACFLFLSCGRNESAPLPVSEGIRFFAQLPSSTKIDRQADGSLLWSVHDSIVVFNGITSDSFIGLNDVPSKKNTFVQGSGKKFAPTDDYYAAYPCRQSVSFDEEGHIFIEIDGKQQTCANNFNPDQFPVVAHSTNTGFYFKNICGGIKFRVGREGVRRVMVCGNDGETIAGKMQLSFDGEYHSVDGFTSGQKKEVYAIPPVDTGYFSVTDWYYIILPPVVFEHGFTMSFEMDGSLRSDFTTSNLVTVSPSYFGVLDCLDLRGDVADAFGRCDTPGIYSSADSDTPSLQLQFQQGQYQTSFAVDKNDSWRSFSMSDPGGTFFSIVECSYSSMTEGSPCTVRCLNPVDEVTEDCIITRIRDNKLWIRCSGSATGYVFPLSIDGL